MKLHFKKVRPDCVSVSCEADPAHVRSKSKLPIRELIRFDESASTISMYPIIAYPSERYFAPKYPQIEEIVLQGFDVTLPNDEDDLRDLLLELPTGFIRGVEWGLGFPKEYRPIVHSIEKLDGITSLVVTKKRATGIEGRRYYLSYGEFEKLRLRLSRITRDHQKKGREQREIEAYNSLLTRLDAVRFPERRSPLKKDAVSRVLDPRFLSELSLSRKDREAMMSAIRSSTQRIAKQETQQLYALQRDVEVVSLDVFIARFQEMLSKNLTEGVWQKLFEANPFVLSMLFGYPIVVVVSQAGVGGTALSGRGGKIADFLVRSEGTNNVALIEIKTPQTPLLSGEFRGGVHPPSKALAGSVVQVLDQRYQFQKSIAQIKDSSRITDLASYAVDCVIVAGGIPTGAAEQKSLELFRRSMKDVQVYTFDELLQKMVRLRSFLADDEPSQEQSE